MNALRLQRVSGLDTVQIADVLGVTEAQAEWMIHEERQAEHERAMHGLWPALNGAKVDALRAEGLLP